MSEPINRRDLLSKGISFLIAAPVSVVAMHAFAKEAAKPAAAKPTAPAAAKPATPASAAAGANLKLVDPDKDPVAKALKYQHSASKIDAKIRVAKMGVTGDKQFCSNCQLYTPASDGSKTGKCSMIAGGSVSSEGWCTSWIKSPKA